MKNLLNMKECQVLDTKQQKEISAGAQTGNNQTCPEGHEYLYTLPCGGVVCASPCMIGRGHPDCDPDD